MNFIEKFSGIFLIAGFFMFLVAFIGLAVIPVWMVEKSDAMAEIALEVPEDFQGEYPSLESYKAAITKGRDLYIAEGCWHCHSQYVRPTANEALRYGPVSTAGEYQNALHMPQLFGTRRVGPDLIRESGKHTNDWHYAHLYNPISVVPESVMPTYPWYFDMKDDIPVPNANGKAIVAYLQWLGKDSAGRKENPYDFETATLPPRE